MRAWQHALPERLSELEITDTNVYQLQPREAQGRCRFRFVAPLPPGSRDRGLPEGLEVLPGQRAWVSTSLRSDLTLDSEGRILSHQDTITDGYDVPATISRYHFLMARNLGEPVPVWYWKVRRRRKSLPHSPHPPYPSYLLEERRHPE